MVGCELVISGRNTSTLPDLVEEPLDQVAGTIQIGAKAVWVLATRVLLPQHDGALAELGSITSGTMKPLYRSVTPLDAWRLPTSN
jgi:hypothetical protein